MLEFLMTFPMTYMPGWIPPFACVDNRAQTIHQVSTAATDV